MPLRGKGAADLPATVRAVTESGCSGADVIGFWTALGFLRRYSMVKQGFSVTCHLDDLFVQVTGAGCNQPFLACSFTCSSALTASYAVIINLACDFVSANNRE